MRHLTQSPRDPGFVQEPYPFYDMARAAGDLFYWDDYGFPCAAGYAAVNAILRDRRFGREWPADLKPPRPAHLKDFHAVDDLSMLDLEPPTHTRLRGLVLRSFTSRRIAQLSPMIERISAELLNSMHGDSVDLLSSFAEPLPVRVIAHLLGVPVEASPQLLAWSHDMVAIYQARRDRTIEDRANAAAAEFTAFLTDCIRERSKSPGDDLLSHLIRAESEGDRLSQAELVATCILLLNAGHEATVHAIGNGVATVLAQGLDGADLSRTPETTAALTEEILRYDPPLHMFTRIALGDCELFGHDFRRGDTVGCLLAAANRDPEIFDKPAAFRPDRANAVRNQSFGAGIHFCLGAPLARLELAIALPMLFRRFPHLRPAAKPVYADRYHFRGLTELRLDLT